MKNTLKLYDIELTSVLSNHSMSIEEIIELSEININEIMKENDIDEWNYEDIELVVE